MRNYFIAICAMLAIFGSGPASANEFGYGNLWGKFYVGGKAGASFLKIKPEKIDLQSKDSIKRAFNHTGFFGAVALGYKFCGGLRVEAEATYRRFDFGRHWFNDIAFKTDLDCWNGMVNGYYDFCLTPRLQPYLGVGIGYVNAFISVKADIDDANTKFKIDMDHHDVAWQGMVGVNYQLTCNLVANLEFRMIQNDNNYQLALGLMRFF